MKTGAHSNLWSTVGDPENYYGSALVSTNCHIQGISCVAFDCNYTVITKIWATRFFF